MFYIKIFYGYVALTDWASQTAWAQDVRAQDKTLPAAVVNAPVKDLTLKEVLEKTLAQDPRIRSASLALESAESSISRNLSSFFPTLDATLAAGTFHDKAPLTNEILPATSPRDRNNYEGQLTLRQSLFNGFEDASNTRGARSDRDAKQMNLYLKRSEILEEVIIRYFELQALSRQLAAEEEVSVFRKRQFQEVSARIAAGRATELEKLQAEYAVEAQGPLIEDLKTQIESGLVELLQNIGETVGSRVTLKDSLEGASAKLDELSLPPFAVAQENARKNNFELRKSTAEIEASDAAAVSTLAKHLPKVDFELFALTKASRRSDIATSDYLSYAGQIKVTVPLFSGLTSVWERREAATRKAALQEDRVDKWNDITTDLYKRYRAWDLAKAKERAETVNLKLTAQKIKSAESSYRNGRATMTDLLDSYSQDLTARRNLANAQLDKLRSFFAIKRLTGENIQFGS